MEKTRSNYALFSFDGNTQRHEAYIERKRRLETMLDKAVRKAKMEDLGDQMIAARIEMDQETHLLVCIYKNRSFAAVMDSGSKEINFNENENRLVNTKMAYFDKLELRLENAVNYMVRNGEPSPVNADVNRLWEPAVPVLEKIIDFETSLEKMPDSRRQLFQNGTVYEQRIDEIIHSYENTLHPLVEQAWEDYLGVDIGASGMRNMDRSMSHLEEDILEKTFHRDFGGTGFVDDPWHQKEHVEPLQQRFEQARNNAPSRQSESRNSIQKVDRELTREL